MSDGRFAHAVADGEGISLVVAAGDRLTVSGDSAAMARVVDFATANAATNTDAELAVRVHGEEDLAAALEDIDPELLVLAGTLERVLELLEDVPAGKLAIAELVSPSEDDIAELERAGMDAVIVGEDELP